MTLAVPTHFADTIGSAAATGVEAAAHLLQEVSSAVSNAAASTSNRAHTLSRLGRHGRRPNTTGRYLVIVGVLAAVAALAILSRRSKSSSSARPDFAGASDDSSRAPSKDAASKAAASKDAASKDAVGATTS